MGFTPNWSSACVLVHKHNRQLAVQVAHWAVNSGEWSQSNTCLPRQAALRVYCCGLTDRCSQWDEFWSSYNVSKIKCTVEHQNSPLWKSKQRSKTETFTCLLPPLSPLHPPFPWKELYICLLHFGKFAFKASFKQSLSRQLKLKEKVSLIVIFICHFKSVRCLSECPTPTPTPIPTNHLCLQRISYHTDKFSS